MATKKKGYNEILNDVTKASGTAAFDRNVDYATKLNEQIGAGADYDTVSSTLASRIAKANSDPNLAKYTYDSATQNAVSYLSSIAPELAQETPEFSYKTAPVIASRYQNTIDDLFNQIVNRGSFSYNPESDPLYQNYANQYRRNGQLAMQNTLGQVSARTGGLASSYAGSAAQQAYDRYMEALNDKIPELYQIAYNQYADELNNQRANLDTLRALNSDDLAIQQANLAQFNKDEDRRYNLYADTWDRNYQLERDNISDSLRDLQTRYDMNRDTISDQRYADETSYNRSQAAQEAEYKRNQSLRNDARDEVDAILSAGGTPDSALVSLSGYSDAYIQSAKNYYRQQAALKSAGSGSGSSDENTGSLYNDIYNSGMNVRAYLAYKGIKDEDGEIAADYENWLKNKNPPAQKGEKYTDKQLREFAFKLNNLRVNASVEEKDAAVSRIIDAFKDGHISESQAIGFFHAVGLTDEEIREFVE